MGKVKIGDLFNLEKGSLQSSKCTPGEYYFITAAEEWKTHNKFSHDIEALIFAAMASGSLGRTHYINGKFIASDLCYIMTPKDSNKYPINLKFYHFVFNSLKDEIVKNTKSGTSKESINQTNLKNYKIPYFDIEQQDLWIEKLINTKDTKEELVEEIQTQQTLLKKLRQAILQEAIEGKLTKAWREAHPDVEPASLLLKKIKAEKEQLVKEKKIRKQKPLPPISDEEKPFEIPEGWEWCRLGTIFFTTSGGTPTRGNPTYWNGNISWLKSGEMTDGLIADESEEKITEEGLEKSSATLFPENTLLIAMYGATAGKLGILKFPSTTNQAICGFYENTYVLQMYLFYYMRAMRDKIIEDSWGQSQPNISQTYLKELAFPLAPLEEQKEIVKKIEALFKICDELEEQISHTKADSEMLMQAVLREAFEEHA